jgi:hypothetical protein
MYNIYLVRGYKIYGLVFIEKAYEGDHLDLVTDLVTKQYKHQRDYSGYGPNIEDILKIGETDAPMDRYGKYNYCGHIKIADLEYTKAYINLVTWSKS